MDRDLKRSADRATLKLDRVTSERDALQAQLEKSQAAAAADRKRADAAAKDLNDVNVRMGKLEADLMASRQKVRELEETALAARQGMPSTRPVQP